MASSDVIITANLSTDKETGEVLIVPPLSTVSHATIVEANEYINRGEGVVIHIVDPPLPTVYQFIFGKFEDPEWVLNFVTKDMLVLFLSRLEVSKVRYDMTHPPTDAERELALHIAHVFPQMNLMHIYWETSLKKAAFKNKKVY